MGFSPDRMDALVWAITELMVGVVSHEGLMDYYRQEAQAVAARLSGNAPALPDATISLKAPQGINTAFGGDGTKYLMGDDGLFHVREVDVRPLESAGFRRDFGPMHLTSGRQRVVKGKSWSGRVDLG